MTTKGESYPGGISSHERDLQHFMAKSVGKSTAPTTKKDYKPIPLSFYLPGVEIRSSIGRKKKARNALELGENVPIGSLRKKKPKSKKKKSKKSRKTVIQLEALDPYSRKVYEDSRGRRKKEKSKYVHTFYDKDQRKPVSTDHAFHEPLLRTTHTKKGKPIRMRKSTMSDAAHKKKYKKAKAHSTLLAEAWHDFHYKPIKGEEAYIKSVRRAKKAKKKSKKSKKKV